MAEISLELVADVREALRRMEDFQRRSSESLGKVEKSMASVDTAVGKIGDTFGKLKGIAVAALGFIAVDKIADFFRAGIEGAQREEDAINRLGNAMALTGSYSDVALESFQKFAASMETTTRHGDDLVLSQLAIAKSFGLTNDQAQDLVRAAADLAAATGDTLEGAVSKLGKTYSGTAGQMAKQIPALKDLTAEQLKAGAAVDYIAQRFAGSAENEIRTYSGAIHQARNAFDNFQESIGAIITKNPALIGLIRGITTIFQEMQKAVDDNSGALGEIVTVIADRLMVEIPALVSSLEVIAQSFAIIRGENPFEDVADAARDARPIVADLADTFLTLTQTYYAIARGRSIIDSAFIPSEENLRDLAEIEEEYKRIAELRQKLADQTISIAFAEGSEAQVKASETAVGRIKKAFDELRVAARGAGGKGGTTKFPNQAPGASGGGGGAAAPAPSSTGDEMPILDFGESERQLAPLFEGMGKQLEAGGESAALGFVNAMTQGGKEGARAFIGAAAGGVALAFGASGPVAGAIGQVFQFLGQDPDTFREAIDGFVAGIPEVIDNIVANIPYLVEVLAENSGEIITALIAASPRIVVALAKAMPTVARALADEITEGLAYQMGKFNGGADISAGKIRAGGTDFANSVKAVGAEFDRSLRLGLPEALRLGGIELRRGIQEGVASLIAGFGYTINGLIDNAANLKQAGFDTRNQISQGAMVAREFLKGGALDARATFSAGVAESAMNLKDGALLAKDEIRVAGAEAWAGFRDNISTYFETKFKDIMAAAGREISEIWRDMFGGLVTDFRGAIANAGTAFYNTIANAGVDFYNNMVDVVNDLFGGSGSALSLPGHASGLTEVPAGFPNDTYAARLTTGERVVDTDANRDLKDFLARQKAGGEPGVLNLLGQILAAVQAPIQAPVSVEVDGRRLADVILNLNRAGARLA